MVTKLQWALRLACLGHGEAAGHPLPLALHLRHCPRCPMESGEQQLHLTHPLIVQVKKEAQAMVGKAWKTMPWAWAMEEGSLAQEGGGAQEAVKEVLKALGVDLVLTERTA